MTAAQQQQPFVHIRHGRDNANPHVARDLKRSLVVRRTGL